ncbi:YbaB/EbfC family nucleoid-associated protein [Bartonella sp. A05]|uniref:YbaB/EbfC family nucleoid-associated protein n=1 Tax=Bartonella sp. A05 TaxID=2967261 RepID=UPI0022A9DBE6|nr:YbaB/EbfC family nucleoid-associated protein [Bartonella sp. A05]MCZ2203378.1 YbaB/EbfC family nucleoid-associated protein [Bartonella sp. A05]
MRDMMGIMKKAKEMQEKMQKLQDEMANLQITGTAGGGLVNVTLNGKNAITAIKIDPSLFKPEEAEILEDLIMAAHNEAKAKIETAMAEKTQSMTAGLPIPPGFKLPF